MAREFLLRRLQESNQLFANVWRVQEELSPLDFSKTSKTFPREEPLSLATRKPSGDEILARCSPDSGIFSPSSLPGKIQASISHHSQDIPYQTLLMPVTSLPQQLPTSRMDSASSSEGFQLDAKKSKSIGRRSPKQKTALSPRVTKRTKERSKPATKRLKSLKKLPFDEDKSSPVSGTIIRDVDDDDGDEEHRVIRNGDIDPAFNLVEITDEVRAELAQIENKIGDYVCKLCKNWYEDAFGLAQHRCSRIIHLEYRCPECSKVFNCPANLASHRRWHKPRPDGPSKAKMKRDAAFETKVGPSVVNPPLSSAPSSEASSRPSSPATSSSEFSTNKYQCSICSFSLNNYSELQEHYKSHIICDPLYGEARGNNGFGSMRRHAPIFMPESSLTPVATSH